MDEMHLKIIWKSMELHQLIISKGGVKETEKLQQEFSTMGSWLEETSKMVKSSIPSSEILNIVVEKNHASSSSGKAVTAGSDERKYRVQYDNVLPASEPDRSYRLKVTNGPVEYQEYVHAAHHLHYCITSFEDGIKQIANPSSSSNTAISIIALKVYCDDDMHWVYFETQNHAMMYNSTSESDEWLYNHKNLFSPKDSPSYMLYVTPSKVDFQESGNTIRVDFPQSPDPPGRKAFKAVTKTATLYLVPDGNGAIKAQPIPSYVWETLD